MHSIVPSSVENRNSKKLEDTSLIMKIHLEIAPEEMFLKKEAGKESIRIMTALFIDASTLIFMFP